jgi:hypothetical protein
MTVVKHTKIALTKNWALEFVSILHKRWDSGGVSFNTGLNLRDDHRGFGFYLFLFKWQLEFSIYDVRHKGDY